MKRRNFITAIALTMVMGLSLTAYATSETAPVNPVATSVRSTMNLARTTGMRGYEFVTSILKNKLQLTDTEIETARSSGKNLYTLAKEKGMSEDEFKAALIEEKGKALDEAVKKGTITREEADKIMADIKANTESCTGNFGSNMGSKGQGKGQGQGLKNGSGFKGGNGNGMKNGNGMQNGGRTGNSK